MSRFSAHREDDHALPSSRARSHDEAAPPPRALPEWQRSVSNRAVARLLQAEPRMVGAHDESERAADRAAEVVQQSGLRGPGGGQGGMSVQRNHDPVSGAPETATGEAAMSVLPGQPAPGETIELAGRQLSENVPAMELELQRVVVEQGMDGLFSLSAELNGQIEREGREVGEAETFREQAERFPGDVSGTPWTGEMFQERRVRIDRMVRIAGIMDDWAGELQLKHEAFKTLVRNATRVRLELNRRALAEWKTFLDTQVTPEQLRAEVVAQQERDVLMQAVHSQRGAMAMGWYEQRGQTRSRARQHVLGRAISGEIGGPCEFCHELKGAIDWEYAHPDLAFSSETLLEYLARQGEREQAAPAARPPFAEPQPGQGQPGAEGGPGPNVPEWVGVHTGGFPGAQAEVQAINAVNPYLRELGPQGYGVLPAEVFQSNATPEQLRTQIDALVEGRRADYDTLSGMIAAPDYDYLQLRPVLRTLLPMADPEVQALVQGDLDRAESDAEVEAIVVGVASLGALLLAIFPPTAPLGIALETGLTAALGVYGVYRGYEDLLQGQMLELGAGADVFDPEQLEAADGLMTMGVLNMVMGGLSLGGLGVRGVRMIRVGEGEQALLEGIQAEAGQHQITVSQLNTSSPQVTVTAPDGAVVFDGPLDAVRAGGPSGGQNVLVVGAERPDEFAYAAEVASRGHRVTVVNPVETEAAQAYSAQGGNFVQKPVEELPLRPEFDLIREDYPFPLGGAFQPTVEFAEARLARLAPGGRWMVVTEDEEFVNALEAAAARPGISTTVRQFPAYHEAAPQSPWPRRTTRFALIFEKSP